jgi:multidrug resistance efflux pump
LAAAQEATQEIESLRKKTEQLQATLAKTKDAFDQTVQDYNSYRKKK